MYDNHIQTVIFGPHYIGRFKEHSVLLNYTYEKRSSFTVNKLQPKIQNTAVNLISLNSCFGKIKAGLSQRQCCLCDCESPLPP
jgi:hypothetical protein